MFKGVVTLIALLLLAGSPPAHAQDASQLMLSQTDMNILTDARINSRLCCNSRQSRPNFGRPWRRQSVQGHRLGTNGLQRWQNDSIRRAKLILSNFCADGRRLWRNDPPG